MHRGGLHESTQTIKEVSSIEELVDYFNTGRTYKLFKENVSFTYQAYDHRTGWDTWLVCDRKFPLGYCDGNFKGFDFLKDDPAAPEVSCKCGMAGCPKCDTYDYAAAAKRHADMLEKYQPRCSNCGHTGTWHRFAERWAGSTSCFHSSCECSKFRTVESDIKEAEQFYAELKARLDERAPA